jgi:crotonobetainyl-CoA:carnitine CoA-transferase CaiB-like acyl-CoA transferase
MHPALDGLRVVEIGMNTVAPLAAKQLGALGAHVIKIEPPTGDTNRTSPPLRGDDGSYNFAVANTDKRGLVLDLRSPEGAAALWDVLETADVLIENLKPGSLERLGFGAQAVRDRHPELIYCSVNGFGFDSAYPGRPAFDTVIQAMSGAMGATIDHGSALKSGLSLADQLGGQFGFLAVLAALDRRDRTGGGATLDLAMQECTAWATQVLWNGGSRTPATVAPVRGGYAVIAGPEPSAEAIAGMTADEASASYPGRVAPVRTIAEMLDHPQTSARELVIERRSADGASWPVLQSPLRLSATPARVGTVMGRLGTAAGTAEARVAWSGGPDRSAVGEVLAR